MLPEFFANVSQTWIFLGIILLTLLVGFGFNRIMFRFINRSTLVIKNDPTNYQFLRHALTALIYLVGFSWAVYQMDNLKAIANSILAGAGILAVAVGFASQHALSNIVGGIFIIIFKPFRINDRLRLRDDSLSGVVEDITLRHTVIRDFENRRIIIPNSVISEEIIINADFADDKIIKWIDFSVHFQTDIDKVRMIVKEIIISHPLNIDGRTPEQIAANEELAPVRLIEFTDFGIHLRAYALAKDSSDAFTLGCDVLEQMKQRFDAEGIELASSVPKL